MADRLDRIFELRTLWARAHGQHTSISGSERVRLHRLLSDFQPGVPSYNSRDPYTSLPTPLPAHLAVNGHFHVASVGNLAADGVAIATEALPELDQWVTLTICDEGHGIDYLFPCRIVSRVMSGPTWLGLRFAGAPGQNRVQGRTSGVWAGPAAEQDRDEGGPLAHRHRRLADD